MKISEFLSNKGIGYIDPKISSNLLVKLVDDFGIPEGTLEFLGAIKKEYNMFSETSFLYKFPKNSMGIGDYLKRLGTLISRIPVERGVDLGIQELDPSRSDGYYILFYLLEEMRDKSFEKQ